MKNAEYTTEVKQELMPDKKYYVSSITPTGIYLDLIKSDIPISELF